MNAPNAAPAVQATGNVSLEAAGSIIADATSNEADVVASVRSIEQQARDVLGPGISPVKSADEARQHGLDRAQPAATVLRGCGVRKVRATE